MGSSPIPSARPFAELLGAFDAAYAKAAPLRYAALRDGLPLDDPRWARFPDAPTELRQLHAWRDGFATGDGWMNEFETDSWYELPPLDTLHHFLPLEAAGQVADMWEDIVRSAPPRRHWKPGFVPFLEQQSFGLVVVDTVGRWGGVPGQIVAFDHSSGGDYEIVAENLGKWLELQLRLLEAGLYFSNRLPEIKAVEREVNGYYWRRVGERIPMDE